MMDNRTIIQLLFLALLIFIALFSLVIVIYRKWINETYKDSVFREKRAKTNYLYASYQFFSQFFLTRHYMLRLRRNYDMIHPKNQRKSGELAMKTAFLVWLTSLVLILLTLVVGVSVYMIFVTVALIYLVSSYITVIAVKNTEKKLLIQFEKFLNMIRHYYYQTGFVDDAIYESMGEVKEPLNVHASMMYEILNAEDMDEAASRYYDVVPNRFIKTFLSLSILISRFGDRMVEGQSLFLQNLTYLKEEINIELRKREKIEHKFKGLIFITVLPMYFLKVLEGWAVSNVPELYGYYHGAYGIITSVGICLISLLIYNVLVFMSDNGEAQRKEHLFLEKISEMPFLSRLLRSYIHKKYGKSMQIDSILKRMGESITVKQFLLKRMLYGIGAFFCGILLLLGIHSSSRYNTVHYTGNLLNISTAASREEITILQDAVIEMTKRYKGSKTITKEDLQDEMIQEGILKNKELMTITAEEVLNRVHNYQSEYIKWYEMVVILILSLFAYQMPFWLLLSKKKMMQMNLEDEVIQFQSIILMLMYIERIAANDILAWMEQFAVFFKSSISECLNNYSAGELEALEALKNKESFEPFQRVVDNLIMCDKIGMKAFQEVAVERRNFQENRKLDNEILINNRGSLAQFLSFLPLFITVGLYLIVPFITEGVNQLSFYFSQINL